MSRLDSAGHPVSGATLAGLEAFEAAAHELRCMIGDPVATIDRALAACPGMAMAHVLKAWCHLLGTEPGGLAIARDGAAEAARFAGDDRERANAAAAAALAEGRWRDAGELLEDLSVEFPRDALALQAGHQVDFFRGDSRMLRDRIARALPHWDRDIPGYHAILGMYAFGLEETGDYAAAEAYGRRSVELEPRDSWGWHAVAHVMEMCRRMRDGIAWLEPSRPTWSRDSFLAVHNHWHLALFKLDLGDAAGALRLYDEAIGGTGSGIVLDLVDASAMLWRLSLRGVDVGDRFEAIADRWAPLAEAGNYAFNDLHAMLAFVGAKRPAEQARVLACQQRQLGDATDNGAFLREAGHPATLAIAAFGASDYAQAATRLRRIRSGAHRFGGSHAQRDLIDLTLLEAARRSGSRALASALAQERAALRAAPGSYQPMPQ